MLRLYIQRHGKSAYPPDVALDHDRPVATRGIEEALQTGKLLAKRRVPPPDLVLCSTAVRAMETLVHWQRGFGSLPKSSIRFEKELYLASLETLLQRIQRLESNIVRSVMLVGHNDGLEQLVRALLSESDHSVDAEKARCQEFVTSAFALFEFSFDSWAKVTPGSGQLKMLLFPKEHRSQKL